MVGDTRLFCLAFPERNKLRDLWDARIYASHLGNPFARRHNFYRKVATIPRHSGNEQGGARENCSCPGRSAVRSTSRSGALQSRGRNERRRLVRSRVCEAALRKGSAPHRARDTKMELYPPEEMPQLIG